MIVVKVDLNQVAALLVEDPYGKQSAVTALLQHSYFGGIRARQVDPGNEGAALGERPSCARIFGKRVDDILGGPTTRSPELGSSALTTPQTARIPVWSSVVRDMVQPAALRA